jgi:hypothetical protein
MKTSNGRVCLNGQMARPIGAIKVDRALQTCAAHLAVRSNGRPVILVLHLRLTEDRIVGESFGLLFLYGDQN